MKLAILTQEKTGTCESFLSRLHNHFIKRGVDSQIIRPLLIGPGISSLRHYEVVIVRCLKSEYLWLTQYLEEMGTRVINSSRALFLSSNKLVSDQIMKRSGLRIPSTLFGLREGILEREETFLFPTLVKPLYGRSHGIAYVESADSLKNLRRKWVYLQQFIPNNGGVTRIYKLGDVVRSFFHPQKGRPREVSVPDDIMEAALRCFFYMEITIGGIDLIEGEDGYYALEVNDLPAGVQLIDNWLDRIGDLVTEVVETNEQRIKSSGVERTEEIMEMLS